MDLSNSLTSSNAVPNAAFLSTGICLTIISAAFIAIRLFASLKQIGSFWLDDYAMVTGLAFLAATFALTYEQQNLMEALFVKSKTMTANDFPAMMQDLIKIHEVGLGSLIVSNLGSWFTKAPLLLLLNRIFGIQTWLKMCVFVALASSLIAVIGATAYSGKVCDPKGQWSVSFTEGCMRGGAVGNLVCGCVGLAIDVVIFILPIPIIIKLHLPARKKVGMIIVFATGFLGIAAGIVGTYSRVKTLKGSASDRQISTLCVILEGTVTIIVGCVPALYYVWCAILSKTSFFAKYITRTATRTTRNMTRTKRTHLNSRGDQIDEQRLASEQALDSSFDGYIRMGTPRKSVEGQTVVHAESDPWDTRARGDDSIPTSYWGVQTKAP